MRQISIYNLWLGNARDGRNSCTLLDAGILAVIDLALEEPPAALVRELSYCCFPLVDGAGNPNWLLRAAVETVAAFVRADVPTLVCCGAGMSRAPAVAAAAIASVRGCTLAEALPLVVASGSGDVSPALLAELKTALS
mgnify:CR=1 FL=1